MVVVSIARYQLIWPKKIALKCVEGGNPQESIDTELEQKSIGSYSESRRISIEAWKEVWYCLP